MRLALPSLAILTAFVAAWALHEARAEEPPMTEIAAGATPGAFALNDQDGNVVRLGSGKDHGWFVLAFYPKASTGG